MHRPGAMPAHRVSANELDAPFDSLFWTPEEGAELLFMELVEDIMWAREYFRDPGSQPRLPRVGIARFVRYSMLGHPPILGLNFGSILVSFCIGMPHGRLPILSWSPLEPIGWSGGHIYYTVQWLSFLPDL